MSHPNTPRSFQKRDTPREDAKAFPQATAASGSPAHNPANSEGLDDTIIVSRLYPSQPSQVLSPNYLKKFPNKKHVEAQGELVPPPTRRFPAAYQRLRLRKIKFLEGAEQLREFPSHLELALKENCRIKKVSQPTCVRTGGVTIPKRNRAKDDEFQVRATNEKLLVAHYQYGARVGGNMRHLTVVQEPTGKTLNRGQTVIIVGARGGHFNRDARAAITQSSFSYWHVWKPTWSKTCRTQNEAEIVRYFQAMKPLPSPNTGLVVSNNDLSLDSQNLRLDQPTNISDHVIAPPKVNHFNCESDRKALAIAQTPISNSISSGELSDSDVPLSQKRKTPRSASFTSASPLFGMASSMSQISQQCPNDGMFALIKSANKSFDIPIQACMGATKPARPMPLAIPSPAPQLSPDSSQHVNQQLTFIFKQARQPNPLRKKTYQYCNTVQMLFAQARAANLIKANDMVLLLSSDTVGGQISARVVHDDPEDFEFFMDSLKPNETASKEVTVLPDHD